MKVLFVSAGAGDGVPRRVVRNQGISLEKEGINITYFTIFGGLKGYFKAVRRLRKVIREEEPDVIHAHYSYSGMVAGLAGASPLVVSLMGSDLMRGPTAVIPVKIFSLLFWDRVIVKSKKMALRFGSANSAVIPNGVDIELFRELDRKQCRKRLGLSETEKIVLFAADTRRREKNFRLAEMAVRATTVENIRLLAVSDVSAEEMVYFYNAADILLLTSLWEGSPNVVKEAMACNLPVVSTDAGDVAEMIKGVEGCFLAGYDVEDIADKISKAISGSGRTNGRSRMMALGLDSGSKATEIMRIYRDMTEK